MVGPLNRICPDGHISDFNIALVFFTVAYYAPFYFQVLGASPTLAGIKVIPLSLGSSLMAIVTGLIVVKTGDYRVVMWAGLAVMTLGFGLMIQLDYNTSLYVPLGFGFSS